MYYNKEFVHQVGKKDYQHNVCCYLQWVCQSVDVL